MEVDRFKYLRREEIGKTRELLRMTMRRQLEFLGHILRREALENLSLTRKQAGLRERGGTSHKLYALHLEDESRRTHHRGITADDQRLKRMEIHDRQRLQ